MSKRLDGTYPQHFCGSFVCLFFHVMQSQKKKPPQPRPNAGSRKKEPSYGHTGTESRSGHRHDVGGVTDPGGSSKADGPLQQSTEGLRDDVSMMSSVAHGRAALGVLLRSVYDTATDVRSNTSNQQTSNSDN